mmetsp:Transcript_13220/g.23936  ORF Transcript_13220/g.23936 Transcript_13220/m.23936 type:complete len:106 (+) Transcript_13220:88-405(+)
MVILSSLVAVLGSDKSASTQNFANFSNVVESAGRGIGLSGGTAVEVSEILVSGSGSSHIQKASRLKLKLFSGIDSAKLFQNVTIDNRLGVVSRRNVNTITKWLQY